MCIRRMHIVVGGVSNAGARGNEWYRGRRVTVRVRGFGELEAVVMDRIWDQDGTTTVREIFDELAAEREIAYTTVMSTMENLHTKGWLARERDGKAYRYWPPVPRAPR